MSEISEGAGSYCSSSKDVEGEGMRYPENSRIDTGCWPDGMGTEVMVLSMNTCRSRTTSTSMARRTSRRVTPGNFRCRDVFSSSERPGTIAE